MISILSLNAGWIVDKSFAVAINNTLDKSYSISTKLSWKVSFCSGSRTSKSAEEGSPCPDLPTLSISSKTNTGLEEPTFFRLLINFPGIAPIYVFLCPLISDSSWSPPKDILTYFLPIASAIDFPNEVLPTPGGPYKHKIGDFISPLSFNTDKYSIILSLTFSNPKWSLSKTFWTLLRLNLSLVYSPHGRSISNWQ